MQCLPPAGVKLNYPLLSDITKGISAEYEVSQPQWLPSQPAFLQSLCSRLHTRTPGSCNCQQTVLHCHTKSVVLLPLQQPHCLGCCPRYHFPGMHSTHLMLLRALFSEHPALQMLCYLRVGLLHLFSLATFTHHA